MVGRFISVILSVAVIVGLSLVPVAPVANVALAQPYVIGANVTPLDSTVDAGENFSVYLWVVDDVAQVYDTVGFRLEYDTTYITATGVTPNPAFTFPVVNTFNNTWSPPMGLITSDNAFFMGPPTSSMWACQIDFTATGTSGVSQLDFVPVVGIDVTDVVHLGSSVLNWSLVSNGSVTVPGDAQVHVDINGGGVYYYISVDMFGDTSKWRISRNGNLVKAVVVASEDGRVTISLDKGTDCLDRDGKRLDGILINEETDLPALPENQHIIGNACKLEPSGAIFDPAFNLTLGYEDNIPQHVSEESIYIAYYNATSESWSALSSQVDTQNNTVTAPVSHFTTFAIIGEATPPAPAEFTITSLDVSSEQVKPGEPVTISTEVTNIGGSEGSYTVNLTVNGTVEQTQTVTLAPEATETVTFTIIKGESGSYSVSIDGKTTEFVVAAPSWLGQYWWTIVAGIIVAGLLVYFLMFRRKRARPATAE